MTSNYSKEMTRRWQNPEYREKMERLYADPDYKAKKSKKMTGVWEDPEYKDNMIKIHKERCANPDFGEKMSKIVTEAWAEPEYRVKQTKNRMEMWTNPEIRAKIIKRQKERWADAEYRASIIPNYSEGAKKRWADPKYKAKMFKLYQSPEYRGKISGENSHSWRGGISFEPYPPDFTRYLKKMIRERDGCKCGLCGVPDSLQIHHINYDKEDSRPQNLITLCVSCHMKTNFNRGMWEEFFMFSSFAMILYS